VFSAKWVQELRKPGKFAMVCLDGYLSMDFSEEEGQYIEGMASMRSLARNYPRD